MTTVLSPSGTPTVFYNRSGMTIDSLTAAASPPSIAHYTGHTVVLVTPDADTSHGVQLPATSAVDIGDVVEVCVAAGPITGRSFQLFPASGDTINITGAADTAISVEIMVVVRKTATSTWTVISDF